MIYSSRLIANIDYSALDLPKFSPQQGAFTSVVSTVFAIFAAVSLLIIVIGALQYVVSQGEPQKTAKAKATIMYAIIGLIISLLSFAIVSFVVGRAFG